MRTDYPATPASIVRAHFADRLPRKAPDITRPDLYTEVEVLSTRHCYVCDRLMTGRRVIRETGKLSPGSAGYALMANGKIKKMVCSQACAKKADAYDQTKFDRDWQILKKYVSGKTFAEICEEEEGSSLTQERFRQMANRAAETWAHREGIDLRSMMKKDRERRQKK